MLKLGVIGTNWITGSFVDAAIKTKKYQLMAVYSRTMEKARGFGEKYKARYFMTNLDEFVNLKEMDVVYIASPNSLHFEQSLLVIQAGKHVIVEKPAFSNISEMCAIRKALNEHKVYFFEAAKHIHEANFRLLKEKLKEIGKIEGANLTFMKYSSRYQQVLAGEEPNIFSLKFSGGALVDLGVYLVYAAVELFGIPKETFYYHQKVATRVDGIGTIIFRYPYFDVIMQTGKIADSLLPCEIYGSKSTLIFDSIHDISSIELYHRNSNQKEQFANVRPEYDMMEEANDFAEMIERMDEMYYRTKYQHYMELSVHVNKIITELREKSGILFEVDNK